jgi:hypothetical protein
MVGLSTAAFSSLKLDTYVQVFHIAVGAQKKYTRKTIATAVCKNRLNRLFMSSSFRLIVFCSMNHRAIEAPGVSCFELRNSIL